VEQEEKRAALLEQEEEELKELSMKHEQDMKDWRDKDVRIYFTSFQFSVKDKRLAQ
jgi:hypothetical protein